MSEDPPVWSNWILVIVAVAAGVVAYRQFRQERDAVHLTERADVLFETTRFFDSATQTYSEEIHPTTEVVIVHRNFGRTTATNVRIRWAFFIEGDKVPDVPFLPPAVIGANAILETRVGGSMGAIAGSMARYNQIGDGRVLLRAVGELTYTDVFKKPHHARFTGVFLPTRFAFAVDVESTD